jgi:type III pantothenate kinase
LNLIVEIGNTALKAAWTEEKTLGKTYRYQGERRMEFICSITEKEKPGVLVVSSVYEISPADEKRLRKECRQLVILDPAHPLTASSYGFPSYLSYDRAAALLAARHLFKDRGCTVVDFGTTLTVDYIDAEGRYEGGNISLGCRTRFKALNRYSRSLPLLDTPESVPVLGTSVESSIASGLISGIIFEIQSYIDRKPDNVVIFTGGDAIYFVKKMKNSIFVVCNLVLIGLALITDDYVRKEDD